MKFDSTSIPFVETGLGADAVWFGGGRIGLSVAAHGGIERIVYYGRQSLGRSAFFGTDTRSAYVKLFKPYLLVEGKAYRLELNNTRLYPGGYRSTFQVPGQGIEVEHDLILVTDAVLHTLRVIRNPRKKALRLRVAWHEYTRRTPEGRTWGTWQGKLAKNTWAVRIVDRPGKERAGVTWFGVVAEKPLAMRTTHSGRRFFETGEFRSGALTAAALFGYNKADFVHRATAMSRGASKENRASVEGWEKRLAVVPQLGLGIPAVESFFRLSPLLLESMMPNDLPGAMRASAGAYWVWGWDTLVHCEAYLAAGQHGFLKDALALYHRTAHPTKGIGHQFGLDMELKMAQAPAAQGLYSYALYQYIAYTGDVKVLKKHYPLILTILKLALASRNRTGLFEGRALFPDEPECAGHNGHDISVFNNSIFYQAARSVEHLAGWMGDTITAQKARGIWQDLAKAFGHLWDAKRGYWVDSVDSRDLAPRRSYPSHAILCFSPFASELLRGLETACSRFMAEHLVYANGLRMYPLWDPSFNGDGNQFGQHYPVGGDPLFLLASAMEGRQDLLERWLDWVKQFWDQNTVPEGVTVEAENEGPQYPDAPGCKQAFSAKAWYMGILNAILGVHFDAGGVTIGPGLDRPVRIDGIYFAGRRWNFRTCGKGRYIQRLSINGVDVLGACKIPADAALSRTATVEITRGSKPFSKAQLLSADGARLSQWQSRKGGFQVHLDSPGSIFVRYASPQKPRITWRGKPISAVHDSRSGQGSVFLASDEYGPIKGDLSIE